MAIIFPDYEKMFKKGSIVEVSSEDEGLRGSWYTATVIKTLSRKSNKLLVEYHNLMADSANPSRPLREMVDAVLLRPVAPRDPPSRRFRLMEDVDAFHNDGWWEGVVTSVNDGCFPIRYTVFFRCSREQIEFSASDLRLHREWLPPNHWLPPLSPCQRIRNGGDRDGVSGNNGEVNDAGRGTKIVSNTQNGIPKNGNTQLNKLTSNGSGSPHVVKKKIVLGLGGQRTGSINNGFGSTLRVKKDMKLKQHPRKSASSHAGNQQVRHMTNSVSGFDACLGMNKQPSTYQM